MAVVILLVATWMNYLRNVRPKTGFNLAVEGLGGEISPGGGGTYIRREDVVGEGDALLGGGNEVGAFTPTSAGESELASTEGDADEFTATGKETIYRGILWMKEKYEQYREEADRRYEQLREELGRSERKYQEVIATMEQNRISALGSVTDNRQIAAMTAEEGEIMAPELKAQLAEVRGQLIVNQGIIEELESQLRSERMKVEELTVKLQANSQLLQTIYQELDRSSHVGHGIPDLGK
jgi:hypothetical protein